MKTKLALSIVKLLVITFLATGIIYSAYRDFSQTKQLNKQLEVINVTMQNVTESNRELIDRIDKVLEQNQQVLEQNQAVLKQLLVQNTSGNNTNQPSQQTDAIAGGDQQ